MRLIHMLFLTVFCLLPMSVMAQMPLSNNTGPYWAVDPATQASIKDISIMDVNLGMNIGQIVKTLEAKGYRSSPHSQGTRIYKDGAPDIIQVRASGNKRAGTSFQQTDLPDEIVYNLATSNKGTITQCPVVEKVLDTICKQGRNQKPCFTKGGQTMAQIFNQHSLDKQRIYSIKVKLDISAQRSHCTVTLKQDKTGLPQF